MFQAGARNSSRLTLPWRSGGAFRRQEILGKALNSLSLTIAAGSSQIQRNIISERILGHPKDR
jgi:alkylation response protein AidB-like acyl-CoA dehydrogenase